MLHIIAILFPSTNMAPAVDLKQHKHPAFTKNKNISFKNYVGKIHRNYRR